MKVQEVKRYIFDGIEHSSLEAVKSKVQDIIGEKVIDVISSEIEIKHKDLIPLLNVLCSKGIRDVLTKCYSVTYEEVTHNYEEGEFEVDVKNILDL